jgi:hypothetical protein
MTTKTHGTGFLAATMRSLLDDGYTPATLRQALFDAAGEEYQSTPEERQRAAEQYRRNDGSAEIQIDSDAMASRADDGMWVQAWLWLPED